MFAQGTFINDPNATPSELERKREAIRAMLGQYGKARYVGEGIADMFTGIANGIGSARLNKQEREAREQATNQYEDVLGGWNPFGGNISTSGTQTHGAGGAFGDPYGARNTAMASNGGPTNAAADAMGIRQGLIDRGLPEHIADGFIMNFEDESGLNPGINEQAPLVPGSLGGFGLAQWTGPRRRALEQFAAQRGTPMSDVNTQLDFLMTELQGPESRAAAKIMAANDAGSAGAAIVNEFLRPAEEHRARRVAEYTGGGTVSTQGSGGGYPAYTGPAVQDLAQLMANPWLTPEQRASVGVMLQQAQQASDPMRQVQWQQAQQQMALNDEKLRQMRQPAPGYRQVSGAELGLSGDQAGALFNVGPDGKVSQIGGGGTNVSIDMGNGTPGLGKLSTDYGYVMNPDGTPRIDPQTGLPQAAAVPGSPAAQESAQREQQAGMRQEQAGRAANIVMQDINRALEQSEGWGTTGTVGSWLDGLGGTPAHDLNNTLRTVRANIGFDRLQQMREASPTGGALGAVSERELTELQAVLGSIEQTQSRDQLQRNLTRLRDVYSNILRKASAYPNAEDFGFGAQPESDELPAAAPDYLTDQDKELWEIMTPEERRAVLGSY